MLNREELRKKLNTYSKEEIIEALLKSNIASGFVLEKCKNIKPNKSEAPKKEAK